LTLSVRDDGRGFSPRRLRSDGLNHGVVGMRERAKLLGGRLQISSAPGKGTRIVARVPIVPEEAAGA
jgi:signal transduction histidine kinase